MEKIKYFFGNYKEEIVVCILLILVGTASYGLGILSVSHENPGIIIEDTTLGNQPVSTSTITTSVTPKEVGYVAGNETTTVKNIVASRNGKAYYFLNCSGVSRILEKNKIYFSTEEEAKKAGYYLAVNCKRE